MHNFLVQVRKVRDRRRRTKEAWRIVSTKIVETSFVLVLPFKRWRRRLKSLTFPFPSKNRTGSVLNCFWTGKKLRFEKNWQKHSFSTQIDGEAVVHFFRVLDSIINLRSPPLLLRLVKNEPQKFNLKMDGSPIGEGPENEWLATQLNIDYVLFGVHHACMRMRSKHPEWNGHSDSDWSNTGTVT